MLQLLGGCDPFGSEPVSDEKRGVTVGSYPGGPHVGLSQLVVGHAGQLGCLDTGHDARELTRPGRRNRPRCPQRLPPIGCAGHTSASYIRGFESVERSGSS